MEKSGVMSDVKASNSGVPVEYTVPGEYQPPAAQLLSELHEIDDTNAPPPVFNAAVPGTSIAAPQDPAISLTTKAWPLPELSK